MNRVGRKTPVWMNSLTGEVVCAPTIQGALGLSWAVTAPDNWVEVTVLPKDQRVVIDEDGCVLPSNDVTKAIASSAVRAGELTVTAYRRKHTVRVVYCDCTKVILGPSK